MPDSQLFVSGKGRYSDDFTKFRGADFINPWFIIWAIYEGHFEADGSRGGNEYADLSSHRREIKRIYCHIVLKGRVHELQ
jgi:hypothetical protein|tara:strand:- start:47434 stop:47673 length:240 start_codon:yes stop_codon:yes gene_type:complete